MYPSRIFVGVFGLPALMLLGWLGFTFAARDRLPDPVATHWGLAGRVDGTMSLAAFVILGIVMSVVLWWLGAATAISHRSPAQFRTARAAMAWCCGVTAFMSVVGIAITLGNLDKTTAQNATMPMLTVVAVAILGAAGWIVGWLLAGPVPAGVEVTRDFPAPVPHLELRDDEDPVWHGRLTSSLMLALTMLTVVAGLVLLMLSSAAGWVLLATAPILAVFCVIDVTADRTGLMVRLGPLGIPRLRIGMERVVAVTAQDIDPMEWGGWGYRVTSGGTAIVLRGGPALILRLTNGRDFAVTVDDAVGAARVLDACRRRASAR